MLRPGRTSLLSHLVVREECQPPQEKVSSRESLLLEREGRMSENFVRTRLTYVDVSAAGLAVV